jgi:CRP/FNR family transcriptional regulator, anaerobic regulatory protein
MDKSLQGKAITASIDPRYPGARIRCFSRGDTVYEPGLTAFVGYVLEGAIKLVSYLPDGRTNIVGVIEAPGFFGRIFGIAAEFTIEAATDVRLACFDPAAFEMQLSESPRLERSIHIENLYQLEEAHERIVVLACQTIIERLATFLMLRLLASEVQSAPGIRASQVHVPINRRDLASYLGTTVETISRSLQALVRRGTISIIDSANFRVLKRGDLFRIAGQNEADLVEMVRRRVPASKTSSVAAAQTSQAPYWRGGQGVADHPRASGSFEAVAAE